MHMAGEFHSNGWLAILPFYNTFHQKAFVPETLLTVNSSSFQALHAFVSYTI